MIHGLAIEHATSCVETSSHCGDRKISKWTSFFRRSREMLLGSTGRRNIYRVLCIIETWPHEILHDLSGTRPAGGSPCTDKCRPKREHDHPSVSCWEQLASTYTYTIHLKIVEPSGEIRVLVVDVSSLKRPTFCSSFCVRSC